MSGLYTKYQVWKDGQSVTDVFVLRPNNDPAAKEAVLRYAEVTPDQELASDLRNWLAALITPRDTDGPD